MARILTLQQAQKVVSVPEFEDETVRLEELFYDGGLVRSDTRIAVCAPEHV